MKFLKQGEDIYVSDNVVIKQADKSTLGSHVAIDDWLYASCVLDIGNYVHISASVSIIGGARGLLKVGHFVGIGTGTRLLCGSSDFLNGGIISSPVLPKHFSGMLNEKLDPIIIEDFVSIGANCTIMNGVTLSIGSSIAGGSVVTKDTEPWTLYMGVPARPYKQLNREKKIAEGMSVGYPFISDYPYAFDSDEKSLDAEAYHNCIYKNGDTNYPYDWHRENMEPIVKQIEEYVTGNVSSHITIVDYGSGTGGSVMEVIKKLDIMGVSYKIYLVDILKSWFHKAYELFKNNPNIKFILNSTTLDGKFKQIPIDHLIPESVDIVMCANMIHLIPSHKLPNTMSSLCNLLKRDGILIINSGNIITPFTDATLFDNPFKNISNNPVMISKIFPSQPRYYEIDDAISSLERVIDSKQYIKMSREELFIFCCIPRIKQLFIADDPDQYIRDKLEEFPDYTIFTWCLFVYAKK